jgi:hypothetical protein
MYQNLEFVKDMKNIQHKSRNMDSISDQISQNQRHVKSSFKQNLEVRLSQRTTNHHDYLIL